MTAEFDGAREYAGLLLKLHQLDPRGERESPQLNAICEAADFPWERMNGFYRQLMKGLSKDLYALADGRRGTLMLDEHRARWHEQGRQAHRSGDAIAYLEHLRQPFPYGIEKGLIPLFQARMWIQLGFEDVGVLFLREAGKNIGLARMTAIAFLQSLERLNEAAEIAKEVLSDPKANHIEIYSAAAAMYFMAKSLAPDNVTPIIEPILEPLRRVLKEASQNTSFQGSETVAFVVRLLAFALLGLGRHNEAEEVCTKALERSSDNPRFLAIRGIVRFQSKSIEAESDFVRAINLGASFVTPYLWLSIILLERCAFRDVLDICSKALLLEDVSAKPQAWLFELRGIALAELHQPREQVEEEFSQAENLDPESQGRIKSNRAIAIQRLSSSRNLEESRRWVIPDISREMESSIKTEKPQDVVVFSELIASDPQFVKMETVSTPII